MIRSFTEVFSQHKEQNKKEKYDVISLQRDEDTGLLQTSVQNFMQNEKKKRQGMRKMSPPSQEIKETVVDSNVGSVQN